MPPPKVQSNGRGEENNARWRRIFKRPEPRVLLGLLVLAGAVLAFLVIADEVGESDTDGFDERIIRLLRTGGVDSRPIGPEWLLGAMRDISALGSAVVVVLLVLAVTGYLFIRKWHIHAIMLIAASIGGATLAGVFKSIYDRPRPAAELRLTDAALASFPSGHSTITAVLYLTLGAMVARLTPTVAGRVFVLCSAFAVTVLVGVSRVYLGVHYPTDVLAGWTLGLAWALFCWIAPRHVGLRDGRSPSTE